MALMSWVSHDSPFLSIKGVQDELYRRHWEDVNILLQRVLFFQHPFMAEKELDSAIKCDNTRYLCLSG